MKDIKDVLQQAAVVGANYHRICSNAAKARNAIMDLTSTNAATNRLSIEDIKILNSAIQVATKIWDDHSHYKAMEYVKTLSTD